MEAQLAQLAAAAAADTPAAVPVCAGAPLGHASLLAMPVAAALVVLTLPVVGGVCTEGTARIWVQLNRHVL
jgi:hypothetical protein